jgi:hypothetical protein
MIAFETPRADGRRAATPRVSAQGELFPRRELDFFELLEHLEPEPQAAIDGESAA